MTFPWKPRHDDGKPDNRFTARLEWAGAPTQQWVARFCDDWLGTFPTFKEAAERCNAYNRERLQ